LTDFNFPGADQMVWLLKPTASVRCRWYHRCFHRGCQHYRLERSARLAVDLAAQAADFEAQVADFARPVADLAARLALLFPVSMRPSGH